MGVMEWHQTPCLSENGDLYLHQYHLQPQEQQQQQQQSYLSSQPSLQSVPSLTSQFSQYPLPQNLSNTHHQCLNTFSGHNSYVSSITIAGKFIYSGSSDREIRSWKRNPCENDEFEEGNSGNSNLLVAGKGAVKSLVVSGDKLFSAHQDHKIRVWKIDKQLVDEAKYTRLATLPTLGDRASKLFIPKNHVQIRRHKKCTWVHHVDTVSALALSSDESLLFSVSWDRTLKIWRTTDFKCLESITNAHDDAINALAVSSEDEIYTGSADKTIKIWRKNISESKHHLVATLEKHKSGINALALSNDGSVLFSGASDRSIVVWAKVEEEEGGGMVVVGALRGHSKAILCLAVVGDLICSGSADKTVRVWREIERNNNYACLAVLEGHGGPVKCLAAAIDPYSGDDDSYLVYSAGLDCEVKVWQVVVPLLLED
ncbi:hypothetical protein UlMin_008149 [Ulmus minor]